MVVIITSTTLVPGGRGSRISVRYIASQGYIMRPKQDKTHNPLLSLSSRSLTDGLCESHSIESGGRPEPESIAKTECAYEGGVSLWIIKNIFKTLGTRVQLISFRVSVHT